MNETNNSATAMQRAPQPAGSQQAAKAAEFSAATNAIMVNKELLNAVKQALKARLPADHILPADRDIVNFVVREMGKSVRGLYSRVPRRDLYKWFDSDVAKGLHNISEVVDKGRFVDACLIAYLYGEEGVRKWCTSIRIARLPQLSVEEKDHISKIAAAIAAIEGDMLSVRPALPLTESGNLLQSPHD